MAIRIRSHRLPHRSSRLDPCAPCEIARRFPEAIFVLSDSGFSPKKAPRKAVQAKTRHLLAPALGEGPLTPDRHPFLFPSLVGGRALLPYEIDDPFAENHWFWAGF